jgi:hypothetical protein
MLNEITGLATGFAALALSGAGLSLAFLAGLRLLFLGLLARRPGKGRIARGVAVAGLVLLVCGAVLLAGEELDVFRKFTDRAAMPLAGLSVLLAGWVGVRAGRRPAAKGDEAAAAAEAQADDGRAPAEPVERPARADG